VRSIDAASGVTRFAYDQFGNVVSVKDPARAVVRKKSILVPGMASCRNFGLIMAC
jgi:YD repeat-containing protein